jgi:CelD/BcsL family acetyltransferase involved in cellulose biosynthesis
VTVVRSADPRTDPLWHALACRPGGSLFISPPWISAVSDTYGFTPTARVLVATSGGPYAGVAWAEVSDVRGRRRVALPFCDRADPVVPDLAGWRALSRDALDGDVPFAVRCLHTCPAVDDPRLTRATEAAWHETRLDRPLDDLHAALRPQTRRNIAKAERSGVEVVISDEADAITEYYVLHVGLRKGKYRLLPQPREFFHRIWKTFAPLDGIRTALALVGGRPVAGAVYLVWQDTVYYKFGASDAQFLPLRPNDALHWQMLQWAHDRGLRALDWGLSDLDQPGLCAYKRGWSSTEGRICTLTGGLLRPRTDVEDLLRTVTELLTDPSVPNAVTERAGSALYRFFC